MSVLIIKKPKNFDLNQIYASGQVFRWDINPYGGFCRIFAFDKTIDICDGTCNLLVYNASTEENER